ncbi:hypothetical protein C2E23DRAFT_345159 [Lenzites betulinus]|nr:hypothetical protein C2E23DRAFT_345159 [Lenzites betulinus]
MFIVLGPARGLKLSIDILCVIGSLVHVRLTLGTRTPYRMVSIDQDRNLTPLSFCEVVHLATDEEMSPKDVPLRRDVTIGVVCPRWERFFHEDFGTSVAIGGDVPIPTVFTKKAGSICHAPGKYRCGIWGIQLEKRAE